MSKPLDPGNLHRLPPWPLLLAGPIVRRVDSGSAAVFVATSQAVPTITLTVFDGAEESAVALAPQIPGKAATLALGANLHVCVVQATGLALEPGRLYGYDLQFATANGVLDLAALGLLADPVPLGYIPGCRPAFVLPGSLDALRIVHTWCAR